MVIGFQTTGDCLQILGDFLYVMDSNCAFSGCSSKYASSSSVQNLGEASWRAVFSLWESHFEVWPREDNRKYTTVSRSYCILYEWPSTGEWSKANETKLWKVTPWREVLYKFIRMGRISKNIVEAMAPSTVKLPSLTKVVFLLTIAVCYQAVKWWE